MDRTTTRRVVIAASGILLLGGGAALASSGAFDPGEAAQDILDRAAQTLGVEADDLEDALKSATLEQIDERLEGGEITEEQAAALKDAAERGGYPFLRGGLHGPGGPGGFGGLPMGMDPFDAAAEYLGLSMDELRELTSEGQTLAEIAQESDKSVDGLIDALVAAQTASLDEAVDEGQITDEMRDRILDGLEDRVDDLVREGVFGLRTSGRSLQRIPRAWMVRTGGTGPTAPGRASIVRTETAWCLSGRSPISAR
jgi:hypothetical protein